MEFIKTVQKYREENGQSLPLVSSKSNDIFRSKYSSVAVERPKESFNNIMIPGKIYFFDYKTDTKITKKRTFINRSPIGLFCEPYTTPEGEIVYFFIDLTITPPEQRGEILARISERYKSEIKENSNNIKNPQKPIDLRYEKIKYFLNGTGFNFSFTGFRRKFMGNIKVVDYEDWPMLVYLSFNNIEGDSIDEIYKKYREKLNQ